MIKPIIKRVAIVIIGVLIVLVGRGAFYYSGFYSPPPSEMPSYERIVFPAAPSTEFSDVYEEGEGTILIDLAHDNAFDKDELNVLILRLISRGLTIEFFGVEEDLKEKLLGEEEVEKNGNEEQELEEELLGEEETGEDKEKPLDEEEEEELEEGAVGFIVVCPQLEFSEEERETIEEFVANGGKLLLIADPTRRSKMNSLSLQFGLIFEPDYLYNTKENEINYRNIFVTMFMVNEITKDIEKVALYTAGSVSSADSGIAFIDHNTFSSVIETRRGLSPIALSRESKVLAIYDLTFMTEPYNGILDNNQLIANIADWLMSPAEGAESK